MDVVFWIVAVITILLFFVPAFVIRPFRYQSPRALSLAMVLRQWAPLGTLVGGLICAALLYLLWTHARKWGRVGLATGMFLVIFSATMSRLNYFEWMFHPVRQPGFESAGQTKLDSGEMVLALDFNHDQRAYPVSEMAYHHIVNDVVGGVPVVVTY
jgi:hypothetical protein